MEISATANATASGASTRAEASIAETFDNFLTLLTTQLQNQDPLDPLDSSEFTGQLVQFTNVEQNIATNRNLENMLAVSWAHLTAAAASHLGRTIEADGDTTQLVAGKAHWTYEIEGPASAVVLTVTDPAGRLVRTAEGDAALGRRDFVWDGKDNAGGDLPAGPYRLTVTARGGEGKELPAAIGVIGRVDGVETIDGESRLMIGEAAIPLANVRRLSLENEAAATTTQTISALSPGSVENNEGATP